MAEIEFQSCSSLGVHYKLFQSWHGKAVSKISVAKKRSMVSQEDSVQDIYLVHVK